MARDVRWFDGGTIQVYLGVTGWCWTKRADGKISGGTGYGTLDGALAAARAD